MIRSLVRTVAALATGALCSASLFARSFEDVPKSRTGGHAFVRSGSPRTPQSPPPGVFTDSCSNAPVVTEGVFGYSSSGLVAGPTATCRGPFGADPNDCWVAYAPSATGLAMFSNCDASVAAPGAGTTLVDDTYLAIWNGSTCPPTMQLACNEIADLCQAGPSEASIYVTAGSVYYVQVGAWGPSTPVAGSIAIALSVTPPNVFTETCVGAALVSEGVWFYATTGALAGPQSSCGGQFGPDFGDCWIAYAPSSSGLATFANCPGSTLAPGGSTLITDDTYIAVWNGATCPPTTELSCGDEAQFCSLARSSTTLAVTAGNTYYVQVGAWGPSKAVVGSMSIALFTPPPPAGPGDDCTVAVPHPTGVPVPYDSTGFGTPGPSASCANVGPFDVFDFWYVFTAPATGMAVASNCPGSAIAPGGGASPAATYLAAWDGATCPRRIR